MARTLSWCLWRGFVLSPIKIEDQVLQSHIEGHVTVAHHYFRRRDAIRDSAEDQPASKGVQGLSRSMTSGA